MSTITIEVGRKIQSLPKEMTFQNIRTFSGAIGNGGPNIHTDADAARERGMPAPVAQALMSYTFIYELLLREFGPEAVYSGTELEMAFIRPVLADDVITGNAEITAHRRDVDGRPRVELTVWCENGEGAQTAVGTAAISIGDKFPPH